MLLPDTDTNSIQVPVSPCPPNKHPALSTMLMIPRIWLTTLPWASCALAIPLFPFPFDIETLWTLFGGNNIPQQRIFDTAGWYDPRIGGGQMLDVRSHQSSSIQCTEEHCSTHSRTSENLSTLLFLETRIPTFSLKTEFTNMQSKLFSEFLIIRYSSRFEVYRIFGGMLRPTLR